MIFSFQKSVKGNAEFSNFDDPSLMKSWHCLSYFFLKGIFILHTRYFVGTYFYFQELHVEV